MPNVFMLHFRDFSTFLVIKHLPWDLLCSCKVFWLRERKQNQRYYYNNVHFEGVRFICGPHLAIIGPSEARAANESYARKMNIITIITHFYEFTST